VDAIRPSIFSGTRIYTGQSIAAYKMDTRINELAIATKQYGDILRFNKLSNGYLVKHPEDENVLGDIRYSMLPNGTEPLWGIKLNPNNPVAHHVEVVTFRKNTIEVRRGFFRMLMGKDL
jgi:inner membrane protein